MAEPRVPALAPAPKLPQGATVWAAYSGGLDSTVLLHALRESGRAFRAIHVNHHLQPAAASWAEHCRAVAGQLGVPLYVVDVEVAAHDPGGPEAAARHARFAAFRSVMRPGDCLATAHTRDDQAETVLLRLVRGAGVSGLAAIRPVSTLPPYVLWRPLLKVSRQEIRRYAEHHRLRWIEDPQNRDPRFSRSWVRSEILPRLSQRWPAASEQLARTAEHCADAVELLDEIAAADLERCLAAEPGGPGLSVRRLLALPRTRRNNLLRHWAGIGGFELPPFDALARLEREVLRARPDASPVLGWGQAELRRFRDTVFLMRRLPPPPRDQVLHWQGRSDLTLPEGCGVLRVTRAAKSDLALSVAFVRGGERIKPAGARYTRTLRNLFQEEAVPPWIRERMPLLRVDGGLEAVAGRWRTEAFKSLCRRCGLRFRWEHDLPGGGA